ncbi:PspA/IM30 family protein [Dysgonomonas sp. OttesenSCG-928-M03]|nr:PspA/IM30 family protein [Dysgonomonas sp. OttesenSCG-928-M03]
MNIFKRLLRIGQAEIYSIVEKMEDPIQMTEQGIRQMKEDLDEAMESLAQITAVVIRTKNDKVKKQATADDYQNKAVLIMTKVQKGELDIPQGEKFAKEALTLRANLMEEVTILEQQQATHEKSIDGIQKNIDILRFNITKWENELKTLKSRIRVSRATKEVNKQMARIDSNSTVSMLERMKEKVEEEEALAQAYSDIAKKNPTVDEYIDEIMDNTDEKIEHYLNVIKRNLGIS